MARILAVLLVASPLLSLLLDASTVVPVASTNSDSEQNCTDFEGVYILHGLLYVPGPDVCSSCVCYHGSPMWCKTIFCPGPPTKCDKYENGVYCCDFICLDDPPKHPFNNRRGRSSAISWSVANSLASYLARLLALAAAATHCLAFIS